MAQTYIVSGTIAFSAAPDGVSSSNPISQQIVYTSLISEQLVYTAPVSGSAISLGNLTSPKALYFEVESGSCTIKLNTADTTAIPLALSATPLPTDRSNLSLSNPVGLGSLAPVITVTTACVIKIFAVQ